MGDGTVNEELDQMLSNLSDAGCGQEELEHAAQLYETGDAEALLRYLKTVAAETPMIALSPRMWRTSRALQSFCPT